MSGIASCFARLREERRAALVPFITAGDPDLETTEALLRALAQAGADLIEIGVPFSDPAAEGPTIQRASERALAKGATLRRILELVARVRADLEAPLILMGYANPFYAQGVEVFADACVTRGVDGVICPDLPPEEGRELHAALAAREVDAILLTAPTTTPARLALLAEKTRGFLYCVARTGVTGARDTLERDALEAQVRAIRKLQPALPVCVGFGISSGAQAAAVARFADGVVVGSALVDKIEGAANAAEAVQVSAEFVAELAGALRA